MSTNKVSTCNPRSKQAQISREFVSTLKLQGFDLDSDKYGYTYSIQESSMNTDPFVRKALKLWDRTLYDDLDGWTKRVEINVGLEDLRHYDRPQHTLDQIRSNPKASAAWDKAVAYTTSVFKSPTPLTRLHLDDAHKVVAGSTSAGFSFPNQKKSEAVEDIYDLAHYMKHMLKRGHRVYTPPCKLGFRGHLSPKDSMKVRPVWIYPAEITYLETCYLQPFTQHLEANVPQMFFGTGTFRRLRDRLVRPLLGKNEISTDWRFFDKLVPNFAIDEAFKIIKDSFDPHFAAYHRLSGEVKEKFDDNGWTRIFNYVVKYFKETRIMLPDGTVIRKHGGVPSGSMFTQVIDSITNFMMISFLCFYLNIDFEDLAVLGDDSHFISKYFDPHRFVEAALLYLGMISHPDKMKISTDDSNDRTFLGYRFEGLHLHRPDREWFLRALHSERDIGNLGVSASRMLGLTLVGGCNSELFVSFLNYFMKAYPVEGREFVLSTDLNRMFKYVFRTHLNLVLIPRFEDLDWIVIRTFLMNGMSVMNLD